MTEMDRQFGRVLDRLSKLGLADNTIVIFSSDNGPENIHEREATVSGVGSPGPCRGHKGSIYEGGIRVPFIVRWPGHVPARRIEEQAVLGGVDLFPTLCRWAGAKPPDAVKRDLDGEDVSDILQGASRPRSRPLFWENRFWYYEGQGDTVINKSPLLAVREGPWKLLMNPDGSRIELYDIPRDPSELNNKATENPRSSSSSRKTAGLEEIHAAGREDHSAGCRGVQYPWPRGQLD